MNTTKHTTLFAMLFVNLFILQTHAQLLTATKGLEKINTNLQSAKKNKDEYDKNLEQVNNNVAEVKKAKDSTLAQKKMVYSELVKNSDALKKVLLQERTIAGNIAKENDKIILETKQIEQLQSMISQIKKNQVERAQIIADYQSQLATYELHKKSWKEREEQLRLQETSTIQALRGIASEEATWASKKKKYEGELKHWTAEAAKQQKIRDTYRGLAEGR